MARAGRPVRLGRARVREHVLVAGALLAAVAAAGHVVTSDDEPHGARPGADPLALASGPARRPPAGADAEGGLAGAGAAGDVAPASSARGAEAPWQPGEVIDARRRGPPVAEAGGGADDPTPPDPDGERGRAGRRARGPTPTDAAAAPPGGSAGGQSAATDEPPPLAEGTGLTADLYDLDVELQVVPRVSGLRPTLTRLDPIVDFGSDAAFGLPFEPETFVAAWTGYLNVERPGVHLFRVGSDDGARLEVDNRVLLDGDGLHPYAELDGELELTAGLHLVRLTYFENGGSAACRLLWAPPDASGFEVIPRRLLFPVDTARLQDLPIVQSLSVDHAAVGQPVEVVGRGFTDDAGAVEVRFGDALAPLLVASPERLLVVVPPGTDGGPVVVTVGGIPSPGVEFTVDGLFGLHGHFVRAAPPLEALAPLPAGPVDFETLSTLDLSGRFGLPAGAPEAFRDEWRGRLWIHRGGWHRLFLVSDDGARLTLDGEVLIDHDGLHAPSARGGEAFLAEGPHELLVEHFEGGGGATLRLEVEAPGPGGRPTGRRLVPRGWYEPPAALAGRQTPRISALEPPAVAPGGRVVIRGEALADPLAGASLVTLGGVPLPILSPGWGSLVVEVPPGVDSGDLVVRAGPLASAAVPLEVTGFGWAATYVDFDGDAVVLPSLDVLAADAPARRLDRLDPALDFGSDGAFGLPFDPDTFVARWRGRYHVAEAGLHRFVLGSDDGARLAVGGQVLLLDDGLHPYEERAVEVFLPVGPAAIQVDYFENLGGAGCRLLVAPPGGALAPLPRLLVTPDAR